MSEAETTSKSWRLAPLAAAALALGLLVAGLAMGLSNEHIGKVQKAKEVATQAQILASSVTGALAFDDSNAALEYVVALHANPEVEAVGVFDLRGRLVAGFSKPGTSPPQGGWAGAPKFEGAHLVVTAPVVQGVTPLGSVYLRTLVEPLTARLLRYSGIALLIVMASLLVAVLGASNASLMAAQGRLRVEMRERAKAEAALLESQRLEAEAQLAMETERARTALRQTEQQLEFALNAGRLGSWELDLPNGRLTASDIFYASFGIGPETRLDGFEDLSPRIHPADRGRHREAVRKALEDGTDLDSEYRTFAADDEVRWILIRGRAVYDADGKATRMAGVSLDITERKRAEERQQLLLDELNHRVKNTLATVQSIAIQTAKSVARTGSFENAFIARINALSRAHDLLTEVAWEGATLREVVANTLAPYAGQDQAGRVRFDGPAVRLGPNAAVTLTMAFHELATNAAKYGSLSVASGEVDVAWRFEGAPEAGIVELEWRERGGPPVAIPTRRGFGVRLVETGLAREFGGEVQIRFEPEGLSCRMRLPTSGKLQMAA